MEEKKKHMVITIDIGEGNQISVDSMMENINGGDAIRGILAGVMHVAKEIARSSAGEFTMEAVLGAILKNFIFVIQNRDAITNKEET